MQIRELRHIRMVFACKACEVAPITADIPPQLLEKGFASPSVLAMLLTSKYVDALPLNRFKKVLGRHGIDIPRQTLAHGVIQCGEALHPLPNLLGDRMLVIQPDETRVQVLNGPVATRAANPGCECRLAAHQTGRCPSSNTHPSARRKYHFACLALKAMKPSCLGTASQRRHCKRESQPAAGGHYGAFSVEYPTPMPTTGNFGIPRVWRYRVDINDFGDLMMEFYKLILGLTLSVALLGIASCGGTENSDVPNGINVDQKRILLEEVEFELPGQDEDIPYRFYAPSKVAWEGEIIAEPFHLKTGKWQIWYTGNVWSAATERESAAERNNRIGLVLSNLKDFKTLNNLDFEINFLQTDGVSPGLGMSFSQATKGWSMHGGGGGCTPFFMYCVNNFVVAPFGAYGESEPAAQYEWLRPYSKLSNPLADRMSGHKGYQDKESKYWTLTPSAAFIVTPDGVTVDAFIPLLSDQDPSSGNIISALIREMEIDADDLIFPTEHGSLFADQPDKLVYFGGDYGVHFLSELEGIMK